MKQFEKPVYITNDPSGRFKVEDKKDRFKTKFTYLWRDRLIDVIIQDSGADLEAENYFEWILN
jgi:hypothetical protein